LICGGFIVMLFTWVYCLVKGLRFMNIRKWKTSDALNELEKSNNIVVYTNDLNDVPACILRPGRVRKVNNGLDIPLQRS
jgi:hypothetical protein